MNKVWIVEDDDAIRECLASLLRLEGFQVIAFAEGARALEAASKDAVNVWADLVLLDLYTEAMPAFDFVQGLNALASAVGRKLPQICVVSGAADIEKISQHLNADCYFQKPFELSELIRYAKQACKEEAAAG